MCEGEIESVGERDRECERETVFLCSVVVLSYCGILSERNRDREGESV